ncbi:tRNA (guanosine(46)-N7)-methyltransferase TrmB [Candidatus Omnitrophota bacterium]
MGRIIGIERKVRDVSYLAPLLLLENENDPLVWSDVFARQAPLHVEIGFGHGEVLVARAACSPENNYVGIEIDVGRISKTLKRIERDALSANNIRILRIDAEVVFDRFFLPRSIDEISCFFPCPWLKRKHWKNRLFSGPHLRLLNSRLKNQGLLRIVTDAFPYYEWILKEAKGCGFAEQQKRLEPQFNTKFEKKWVAEGQSEFYEVCFIKEKHQEMDVKRGFELKAYTIDSFNPEAFHFAPVRDEQIIVFRSLNYDQEKQEAIVRLFVSEDNLEQHFLVMIRRVEAGWKIFKMDGQNIFRTQGVVRALDLVHQAARQAT